MSSPQLKKSVSQKSNEGNRKNEVISTGGEVNSLNSEPSQPGSARRSRDPRKRMKKNISAKVYENMQSSDVSKMNESNNQDLEMISINTSMNKNDPEKKYQTIDFFSASGLSESTTGGNDTPSGTTQIQTSKSPPTKNVVPQLPRKMNQHQVIDLEMSEQKPSTRSFKRIIIGSVLIIALIIYVGFNIYMTFNPEVSSVEQSDSKETTYNKYAIDQYSHLDKHALKRMEVYKYYEKEIQNCSGHESNDLYYLNLKTCKRERLCDSLEMKSVLQLCVSACPPKMNAVHSKCQFNDDSNSGELKFKLDGEETPTCPVSYYYTNKAVFPMMQLECEKCEQGCHICLHKGQCSSCVEGLYLLNGKCVVGCMADGLNNDIMSGSCLNQSYLELKIQPAYFESEILSKLVSYFVVSLKSCCSTAGGFSSVLYVVGDHNPIGEHLLTKYQGLVNQMNRFKDFRVVLLPSLPESLVGIKTFYRFYVEIISEIEIVHSINTRTQNRWIVGEGAGAFAAFLAAYLGQPKISFGFVGMLNGSIELQDIPSTKSIDHKIGEIAIPYHLLELYLDVNSMTDSQQLRTTMDGLISQAKEDNRVSNGFKYVVNDQVKCKDGDEKDIQQCITNLFDQLFNQLYDFEKSKV